MILLPPAISTGKSHTCFVLFCFKSIGVSKTLHTSSAWVALGVMLFVCYWPHNLVVVSVTGK